MTILPSGTVDPEVAGRPRYLRLGRTHVLAACAVALVSFGQAWYRFIYWRNGFGDIAVIDQAAWLLAHGKDPMISGLGWNAFADHLAPVYLVFGVLYRVRATVGWVFFAEALAFGASVLALPALLDELRVTGRAQAMFQVAFVLNPLMWNAVAFAGHPTTMAVPVIVIGLTAALRGKVSTTAVSATTSASPPPRSRLPGSCPTATVAGACGSRSPGVRSRGR